MMRLFVFGSKFVGAEWTLPECVRSNLDEAMASRNEILVNDREGVNDLVQSYLKKAKHQNVLVCVAGNKSWTRSNVGKWREEYFSVNGRGATAYSSVIERDFGMSEMADQGLAIWDGNDFNTYANMLCMCALGKPCKLYLIAEDRWYDANTISDIVQFRGPDEELTANEICEIMMRCKMPAKTIESVVKEDEFVMQIILDCIDQAEIKLEEKLNLLDLLIAKQNMKYEVYCAVERCLESGKPWKTVKHDVRAVADYRPLGYCDDEVHWKEIRRKWRELDKMLHPKKYIRYFAIGNKEITFDKNGRATISPCDRNSTSSLL